MHMTCLQGNIWDFMQSHATSPQASHCQCCDFLKILLNMCILMHSAAKRIICAPEWLV